MGTWIRSKPRPGQFGYLVKVIKRNCLCEPSKTADSFSLKYTEKVSLVERSVYIVVWYTFEHFLWNHFQVVFIKLLNHSHMIKFLSWLCCLERGTFWHRLLCIGTLGTRCSHILAFRLNIQCLSTNSWCLIIMQIAVSDIALHYD